MFMKPPATDPDFALGLRIVEHLIKRMQNDPVYVYGEAWESDAGALLEDCWNYVSKSNRKKDRKMEEDRMMKWFAYAHLPEQLQSASKPFFEIAEWIIDTLEPWPKRTVALRKLLEAKDVAVRAKLYPGGVT